MIDQVKEGKQIKVINIVICVLLLIATCYSCQNIRIGEIVAILEAGIVIFLAGTGRIDAAVIVHNIFLACSIEVSLFVYSEYTMMYSYSYMPYIHRYGPLVIEIGLLLVILFMQKGKVRLVNISGEKTWMDQFVQYITIMIVAGFFISLIVIAFNDNGINTLSWYSDSYFREITYWAILLIDILIIYNRFKNSPTFANFLKKSLISLFLAVPFASVLSISLGFHGNYSYHINVLLMPLISFYAVGLAVFPSYKDYRLLIFYICAGIMFVAQLTMTNPLLGKWILYIIAIVIVILLNNLSRERFIRFIGILLLLLIAVLFFGNTVLESNELLKYKFEQAIGAISLGNSWLNNMSSSPSIRIEELLNAGVEFSHKPWFFLFGKGIGGTTLHWINWNNWNITSAFPAEQFSSGVFMGMHESMNILFLKYGLVGILFFIWVIVKSVRNISKSPWVFLGLFWFVFFINTYISLYIMIPAFMLGMYESEKMVEGSYNGKTNNTLYRVDRKQLWKQKT